MKCWQCFNDVPDYEIYDDWYRCNRCLENLQIQPERSKREDLYGMPGVLDANGIITMENGEKFDISPLIKDAVL